MIRTVALMGTIVTIHVVGHGEGGHATHETAHVIERAFIAHSRRDA